MSKSSWFKLEFNSRLHCHTVGLCNTLILVKNKIKIKRHWRESEIHLLIMLYYGFTFKVHLLMQPAYCGRDQVNVTWDTETEVHVLWLFLGVYFFEFSVVRSGQFLWLWALGFIPTPTENRFLWLLCWICYDY